MFVADVLHPVHDFAIQRFLNGDMRHRHCWRRFMPVLLVGWKPDHVARADFLYLTAPTLAGAKAGAKGRGTEPLCAAGRGFLC